MSGWEIRKVGRDAQGQSMSTLDSDILDLEKYTTFWYLVKKALEYRLPPELPTNDAYPIIPAVAAKYQRSQCLDWSGTFAFV